MNTNPQIQSRPVSIDVTSGKLFAIEQLPGQSEINNCIIMFNSGMLNRSGPQRLYWSFAQQACSKGMAVIRVDLAGVGDSPTEIDETHFDNHRKEDVNSVIKYARTKWPHANIILQGLCAGARVSFKAAVDNPDVAGIISWSNEIFTASQNMPQSPDEPDDRLSEFEVSDTMSRLLKFIITFNFLKPSWWRKEFPGGKGLIDKTSHTLKCSMKAFLPETVQSKGEFLNAADQYLKDNRKVIFTFGEFDKRALNEFLERFPQIENGTTDSQCHTVIKKGTHTYSTLSSTKEVIQVSINWVESQFK